MANLFETIADNMPEGTWEFVCHPGYVDDDLAGFAPACVRQREEELAVLTSPEARQALDSRGVSS